jgi:hypothetical protein
VGQRCDGGRIVEVGICKPRPADKGSTLIENAKACDTLPVSEVVGGCSEAPRYVNAQREDKSGTLSGNLLSQEGETAADEGSIAGSREPAGRDVATPEAHEEVREEAGTEVNLRLMQGVAEVAPGRPVRILVSSRQRLLVFGLGVEILTQDHDAANREGWQARDL